MQPTFKEKEEGGFYFASLNGTNEGGQHIKCNVEINLKSIQQSETDRCLLLGLDMNTISVRVGNLLIERKKDAISDLHYRFNKYATHTTI